MDAQVQNKGRLLIWTTIVALLALPISYVLGLIGNSIPLIFTNQSLSTTYTITVLDDSLDPALVGAVVCAVGFALGAKLGAVTKRT